MKRFLFFLSLFIPLFLHAANPSFSDFSTNAFNTTSPAKKVNLASTVRINSLVVTNNANILNGVLGIDSTSDISGDTILVPQFWIANNHLTNLIFTADGGLYIGSHAFETWAGSDSDGLTVLRSGEDGDPPTSINVIGVTTKRDFSDSWGILQITGLASSVAATADGSMQVEAQAGDLSGNFLGRAGFHVAPASRNAGKKYNGFYVRSYPSALLTTQINPDANDDGVESSYIFDTPARSNTGAPWGVFRNGGTNLFSLGVAGGFAAKGQIDASAAAAGNIGEVVSSVLAAGSATSLTTATAKNVTSISLTAGDWDVSGNINFTSSAATKTSTSGGITVTTATVPTDGTEVYSGVTTTILSEIDSITIPVRQINISATTTVYLVGKCTFSAGTISAFGSIRARRVFH